MATICEKYESHTGQEYLLFVNNSSRDLADKICQTFNLESAAIKFSLFDQRDVSNCSSFLELR